MPPPKSRYSFPSASHTREPSPRTKANGYRPYVGITYLSNSAINSCVLVIAKKFVTLSEAKGLSPTTEILRCAQNDRKEESFHHFRSDTFVCENFQQHAV